MNDPNLYALQAAIMETLLKEKPDLLDHIMERADFYRDTFFLPGTEVYTTTIDAIDHMKLKVMK